MKATVQVVQASEAYQGPTRRTADRYTMRETRSVSSERWNGWLERVGGGGHIYQSYEWGEFKRGLGWKPVRLVIERDGAVVGLGQFLCWGTPFVSGKLFYSTKGPWLPWDDEEAVATFFKGVQTAARREGAHTIKIEPEVVEGRERVAALLSDLGFRKFRWDLNFKATMILDLSPSEEDLLANMKGKTRYNIRLAARKGVVVVEDDSPEARGRFWRMLEETAVRDGFVLRRRPEYQFALWQAMYDADRAHLFFAEHDGIRLAGMLIYTFGRKYWYALGASTGERRNVMPTYLLQWEVMRWAKARGLDQYDMVGMPTVDNLNEGDPLWGVYRFKAGFGGGVADFIGCLDLPVGRARARLWNVVEPVYYRVYQRLKHDVYY